MNKRAVTRAHCVILMAYTTLLASPNTNHFVQIDEVMAGANGNSAVQFVELRMCCVSQNKWGPQFGETEGRARLVFFDAIGTC